MPDLAALAREIIDSNQYLTLATADADGRPWASPVWFAHEDHSRFLWVSKPDARHSRNLEHRPRAGVDHGPGKPASALPALPSERLGAVRARPGRRAPPRERRLALECQLRVRDRLERHAVER